MELKQRLEVIRGRLSAAEQLAGETMYKRHIPYLALRERDGLTYRVSEQGENHLVRLPMDDGWSCACETFMQRHSCRHLYASVLAASRDHLLQEMMRRKSLSLGERLQGLLSLDLPTEEQWNIKPTLVLHRRGMRGCTVSVELSIGAEKQHAIRSIPKFFQQIMAGEPLSLGRNNSVILSDARLAAGDRNMLTLLQAVYMATKDQSPGQTRRLEIPPETVSAVLGALEAVPAFDLQIENGGEKQLFRNQHVRDRAVSIYFVLQQDARELLLSYRLPAGYMAVAPDDSVVWDGDGLLKVPDQQRRLLRVLDNVSSHGEGMIRFPRERLQEVLTEIIPLLRIHSVVEIHPELDKRLDTTPLQGEVYLDAAGRGMVAAVTFRYGDLTLNPLEKDAAADPPRKIYLRDRVKEQEMLRILLRYGFHLRDGRAWLSGDERLYHFCREGLSALQSCCDVYVSKTLQKITPRTPHLRGSIQMAEGKVNLSLFDGDVPLEEVAGILEALRRKRSYYRLKDGAFLDLTGLEGWNALAETVAADDREEGGTLSPVKALEMVRLLQDHHLRITADERLVQTLDILQAGGIEERDDAGIALHPYQKKGLHWLKTLDHLHLGGILADEMGLGKTVQVIALLRTLGKKGTPSLIVSPSSLTYNWLSELNRFAPELSVMVLSGAAAQRSQQLRHVQTAGDVDVLITSYPLIRRDIDIMENMMFRFAILDEAQYIKNAASVGAFAVKRLQAETRLALTGTPMENGVGELWSIFDFVLPGFFPPFTAFMHKYGSGEETAALQRKIRPFLLRRLKKDVMAELPEKIETRLTAPMTGEQRLVYQAAMLRLRARVNRIMEEKGMAAGRMDVLSALTELRQVCCHPALVLPDYAGSSGKMDLLMDILPTALENGRRVLLFSQFTSMLKLIRRQLELQRISTLYLDGSTPAQERTQLVERFNGGEGDVFLISLKAGGTGLNLTGADMVIHYDPWWNPAAEDQATDRAHRIGQEKRVEVIRLVTHQSIEEQVVELGERKRKLFDQLITPGEELVTALTEQDIRRIFAE